MKQKGQASIEFLLLVLIAVVMLFLGVVVFSQQSTMSRLILDVSSDLIECNKISGAITDINVSTGTAQKNIYLMKPIDINRLSPDRAGRIKIGDAYCGYFGNVAKHDSLNPIADTDLDFEGRPGFTLLQGKYKIAKTNDYVIFIDLEQRS